MQAEIKRPYVEIVWHQTEQLDEDADKQQLSRLQRALAYLLTQSPDAFSRLSRRALVAQDAQQMARLDATKLAVTQGITDPPEMEAPLPTAIAILPLDGEDKVEGELPSDFAWVAESSPKARFKTRDGQGQLGYFESTIPRVDNQAAICTHAQLVQTSPQNSKRQSGLLITVLGLFVFLVAMGSTMKTGSIISDAHRIVSTSSYDVDSSFQNTIAGYCQTDQNLCQGNDAETILTQCESNVLVANEANTNALKLSKLCLVVWNLALKTADLPEPKSWIDGLANAVSLPFTFFYKNGQTIASVDQLSLVSYFYLALIGLTGLFVGLGLTTSGRIVGVAINAQNRLSLSLLQVIIWTIVILSAYATFCAFNIGALSSSLAVTAMRDASGSNSLFPELQAWMWAVMGIVVASPTLSAIIKGGKSESNSLLDAQQSKKGVLNLTLSALDHNNSPKQASFFDIFLGEDEDNATRLDISRAQNVIITALLLFTFSGWLVHSMSAIETTALLSAFLTAQPILTNFPEPGATFTGLLALTHATYLAGKWKPLDS